MDAGLQSMNSLAQTSLAQPPVAPPQPTKDVAVAQKAAQNFESVFISQFLGSMFDGIKTDGMFGGGEGEQMFRSLMIDQYGKQIAAQGGFGLASAVQAQLLKSEGKGH
jgi:Rod binding domain-containing protein